MTEPARCRGRLAPMPTAIRAVVRAVLLALVVAASVSACRGIGGAAVTATGPLVTVTMRGGQCVGGPCDNSVILDRDGRVHSAAKPPNDLGHVSAETMATLTAVVGATDYASIRAHPFTGQCPVAFDGQELVFEFGVGAGTQRIASCEVDIDWGHPLFVGVGAALGEWIPLPLT